MTGQGEAPGRRGQSTPIGHTLVERRDSANRAERNGGRRGQEHHGHRAHYPKFRCAGVDRKEPIS